MRPGTIFAIAVVILGAVVVGGVAGHYLWGNPQVVPVAQVTNQEVDTKIADALTKVPTKETLVVDVTTDPSFATAVKTVVQPDLDAKADKSEVASLSESLAANAEVDGEHTTQLQALAGLPEQVQTQAGQLAEVNTALDGKADKSQVTALETAAQAAREQLAELQQATKSPPVPEAAPESNLPETAQAETPKPPAQSPVTWFSMVGYVANIPSALVSQENRVTAWMDRFMAKCHFNPVDLEGDKKTVTLEMITAMPDDQLQSLYDTCQTKADYQASQESSDGSGKTEDLSTAVDMTGLSSFASTFGETPDDSNLE